MAKKHFTLIFEFFSQEHLGKDPFMVPYYLGKLLDCEVSIVYPAADNNQDLPQELKGVKLIPIQIDQTVPDRDRAVNRAIYRYVWNHAKETDILMRFFDTDSSRKSAMIYKLRNPKGKMYVKMDINPYGITDKAPSFPRNILSHVKGKILKSFVDVISCETQLALQKLEQSPNSYNYWGKKMVYLPNGFDEELLTSLHIKERKLAEKENVMITVGRLGTPQKNTPMLLQALAKVDLKDWKFYLIGPVSPEFQSEIEAFYQQNPDKKGCVIFTGAVYDKKALWEFYNRSKAFVLTSKWEGFALVYTEAQRFTNYIVSTRVGAANDVIQDGKYGEFLAQDDADGLATKLEYIISGKTDINVYDGFDVKSLSWEQRLRVVADRLK